MIIDLLKFTVKDGRGDASAALMKEQAVNTRGDEGCEYAHVFRSKENPDELYMLMAWADQESVEKHLKTEHDLRFREGLDPELARPPEFFELIT